MSEAVRVHFQSDHEAICLAIIENGPAQVPCDAALQQLAPVAPSDPWFLDTRPATLRPYYRDGLVSRGTRDIQRVAENRGENKPDRAMIIQMGSSTQVGSTSATANGQIDLSILRRNDRFKQST
ncbi:hypothetical protein X741_29815 [Mesorhizobium sp. LNHC229A00]|nr:hypothetical protein X741_29815 [Mesorhizobium sp. LNHC229A00]